MLSHLLQWLFLASLSAEERLSLTLAQWALPGQRSCWPVCEAMTSIWEWLTLIYGCATWKIIQPCKHTWQRKSKGKKPDWKELGTKEWRVVWAWLGGVFRGEEFPEERVFHSCYSVQETETERQRHTQSMHAFYSYLIVFPLNIEAKIWIVPNYITFCVGGGAGGGWTI